MRSRIMLVATVLLLGICTCHGARILGIFPTPSISHQLPFQAIMKGLVARGHHVTVISPNPLKVPPENYTDIDLSESYDFAAKWDFHSWDNLPAVDTLSIFNTLFSMVTDFQMSTPQMQKFIKSNGTTFDLIMIERLTYQAYHGLIHHFGSPPVVGVISLGGMAVCHASIGNPHHPAYIPDMMSPYSHNMTFWERMYNTYVNLKLQYVWHYQVLPTQETLMRKYFGSAPPSVYETENNDSLLLINNHWSLDYPRPLLPNVKELTGLHVQTTPKPLPKDIQSFVDNAEHGVVYFSLGSNVKSNNLPEEKLRAIVEAFSVLPQRVIWKWESDTLPGQPDNVMVRKWVPQQDLLAHPNIRVFITQGGLQSFQEAAYNGVPLIGVPFIADQFHNVAKFEDAKIGVKLEFRDITRDTLLGALEKVLNDTSYMKNMKMFSAVYREQVHTSLDRAVSWIEYVLRHNGARHLRSAVLDLKWYQYMLLDLIAVIFIGIISILFVSYIVLRTFISFVVGYIPSSKLKQN